MRVTLSILQKVVINYFYKINTGFFLMVFFVMFGLPQNVMQFHHSLIDGIIKTPSFLLAVMAAWLLYNGKCMDYVIKQLIHPRQHFLYCLYSLPASTAYMYLLYVQAMVYLPAIIYSGCIIVVALQTQHITAAAEVLLFNAMVTCLTPLLYMGVLLRQPVRLMRVPRIKTRLPKPLFSLPLYHIWHNNKQMLFVSKLFSLFVLYIFFKLFQPDHPDVRPVLLCFMLAAAVNLAIIFEIKFFEDTSLSSVRNFPLTVVRRFVNIQLLYVLLLLPELLFVWKGYAVFFTLTDYAQLLLMGTALLSLCYALLFTGITTMDGFIRIIFVILVILFFIILYNPGILLELCMLALAFGLYASYYYDYGEVME
ncbi:MAG TPA: hypothetical protein VHB48_06885 [Chitinophagaceae bacterium]|nr:hypothetical protein [Chitinophagaceae bacterium]